MKKRIKKLKSETNVLPSETTAAGFALDKARKIAEGEILIGKYSPRKGSKVERAKSIKKIKRVPSRREKDKENKKLYKSIWGRSSPGSILKVNDGDVIYNDKYKKLEGSSAQFDQVDSFSEFKTIPGFFPLQSKKVKKPNNIGAFSLGKIVNQTKYLDQTKPLSLRQDQDGSTKTHRYFSFISHVVFLASVFSLSPCFPCLRVCTRIHLQMKPLPRAI